MAAYSSWRQLHAGRGLLGDGQRLGGLGNASGAYEHAAFGLCRQISSSADQLAALDINYTLRKLCVAECKTYLTAGLARSAS